MSFATHQLPIWLPIYLLLCSLQTYLYVSLASLFPANLSSSHTAPSLPIFLSPHLPKLNFIYQTVHLVFHPSNLADYLAA